MDSARRKILVTGGTGYIGSHTVTALYSSGYDPVIVDNLSNSKADVIERIETITGRRPLFYHLDLRDRAGCRTVFQQNSISSVIHFAGLKAVGESVAEPLRYYENNIDSTLALCQMMTEAGVRRLIFSSSATVYGDSATVPIREDFPTAPASPYGRTKLMIEQILQDIYTADSSWRIVLPRYFNPVGAHESGLIGEEPSGIPNNLMPYICQVACGLQPQLSVYGGDYPTPDGTGVRDYIHVMDLAEGHVAALKYMENQQISSDSASLEPLIVNLGSGRGYSVLEVIRSFEQAACRPIPFTIVPRRPGDIACSYADPALAGRLLHWQTTRDLKIMCEDAWRYANRQ